MAKEIEKRKEEHLDICLTKNVQAKKATTGFEDIQFIHRALPEINQHEISLSTSFLGKKLSAPLIVDAMTGGTDKAIQINGLIAETLKIASGYGVRQPEGSYRIPRT